MILDPARKEMRVYYDNRLVLLEGSVDEIVNWVVDMCSMEPDEDSTGFFFKFKGKMCEQITVPVLDAANIGRVFAYAFKELGFKYEELKTYRRKL